MHSPKVSIGLPVYNGEKYLYEALGSLRSQSYSDFELIISDNASTDNTARIALGFANRDPRIRYYRNLTNIGAAPNFGRTLDLARGEFFKWACADDVHLPDFLARCVEMLSAAPPEVALVAPRTFVIDEKGKTLVDGNRFLPERLATHAKTPHGRLADILPLLKWSSAQFGLFRTETLRKTRGIAPFEISDRVLLAETALLGEIWEVDEPLFGYRYHGGKSTELNKNEKDYAVWMDPSSNGKRPLLFLEYVRSVKRLPLSPVERALCLSVIAGVWVKKESGKWLKKKTKNLLPC